MTKNGCPNSWQMNAIINPRVVSQYDDANSGGFISLHCITYGLDSLWNPF